MAARGALTFVVFVCVGVAAAAGEANLGGELGDSTGRNLLLSSDPVPVVITATGGAVIGNVHQSGDNKAIENKDDVIQFKANQNTQLAGNNIAGGNLIAIKASNDEPAKAWGKKPWGKKGGGRKLLNPPTTTTPEGVKVTVTGGAVIGNVDQSGDNKAIKNEGDVIQFKANQNTQLAGNNIKGGNAIIGVLKNDEQPKPWGKKPWGKKGDRKLQTVPEPTTIEFTGGVVAGNVYQSGDNIAVKNKGDVIQFKANQNTQLAGNGVSGGNVIYANLKNYDEPAKPWGKKPWGKKGGGRKLLNPADTTPEPITITLTGGAVIGDVHQSGDNKAKKNEGDVIQFKANQNTQIAGNNIAGGNAIIGKLSNKDVPKPPKKQQKWAP